MRGDQLFRPVRRVAVAAGAALAVTVLLAAVLLLMGMPVTGIAAAAPTGSQDGTATAAEGAATTESDKPGDTPAPSDSTAPSESAVSGPGGLVVDDADVLDPGEEDALATAAATMDGSRVLIVTTPAGSGSLEDDLHALGERAAWNGDDWDSDAVVLALGVSSREIGIYYGAAAYDTVDPASDAIYDAMADQFRNSRWAAGFRAGLRTVDQALRGELPDAAAVDAGSVTSDAYGSDDYGPGDYGSADGSGDEDQDSSSSGMSGWFVVLIIVAVVSVLWRLVRGGSGDGSAGYGDEDDDSWDDGYRRRSTWSSRSRGGWFGGGGSRRSGGWLSGGSSRRSGGSSRRSFGGSSRRSSGGSSRRSGGSHRSHRGGGGSRRF